MSIIEKLIEEGIAQNVFQATHIANGLKLAEMDTDENRLIRARLYRDLRNSKLYPKADTKSCYEHAIRGDALPQQALIPEALHSQEYEDPDAPLRDDEFNEWNK